MKKSLFLIIDSTQDTLCVALYDANEIKRHQVKGKKHSEKLLLTIEEMLSQLNKSKNDISQIIVVTGPGSYTGSRVGVATANALSFGLKKPLCGINKFDIAKIVHSKQDLFAIESFKGHVLLYSSKTNTKKMKKISEIDQEKVIEIQNNGQCTCAKKKCLDYQQEEKMIQWIQEIPRDNFNFKVVTPYYFKSPSATKKRKG